MSGSPAPDRFAATADTSIHVRRAAGGHVESLDWLVRRFSPLLRLQAGYRLGSHVAGRNLVEDVVADAWLAALPKLPALAPREERLTPVLLAFLATSVRRIANDVIRDFLRRRVAVHAGGGGSTDPALSARVKGVLSGLEDQEAAARITGCVRKLAPDLQQIVILRAIEGFSNREIADEIGELPNTVSHRYLRAIASLRACLPGSLFDELSDE